MKSFEDFAESVGRQAWNDIYDIIIGKSRAKNFPLERKIMQPVRIQFLLEAMEEHRTVDEYIQQLKKMANVKTKYDYVVNCWDSYPEVRQRRMLEQILALSGSAANSERSKELAEVKGTAEGDVKNEVREK